MRNITTNLWKDGLKLDSNSMALPNTALSGALNATVITMNGNDAVLLNDMGNGKVESAYLPAGYVPVGMLEFGGIIYIASYNPLTHCSLIGSFPSPERNISSDEVGAPETSFSYFSTVTDTSSKEAGVIKTYVQKLQLMLDVLRPGDKYSIEMQDAKLLANFLLYLKSGSMLFNLAIIDASGNLINIPLLDITASYHYNINDLGEAVIVNDANYTYESFIKLADEDPDNLKLTQFNVYKNKLIGNLYLVLELNVPENLEVSIDGLYNTDGTDALRSGYVSIDLPTYYTCLIGSDSYLYTDAYPKFKLKYAQEEIYEDSVFNGITITGHKQRTYGKYSRFGVVVYTDTAKISKWCDTVEEQGAFLALYPTYTETVVRKDLKNSYQKFDLELVLWDKRGDKEYTTIKTYKYPSSFTFSNGESPLVDSLEITRSAQDVLDNPPNYIKHDNKGYYIEQCYVNGQLGNQYLERVDIDEDTFELRFSNDFIIKHRTTLPADKPAPYYSNTQYYIDNNAEISVDSATNTISSTSSSISLEAYEAFFEPIETVTDEANTYILVGSQMISISDAVIGLKVILSYKVEVECLDSAYGILESTNTYITRNENTVTKIEQTLNTASAVPEFLLLWNEGCKNGSIKVSITPYFHDVITNSDTLVNGGLLEGLKAEYTIDLSKIATGEIEFDTLNYYLNTTKINSTDPSASLYFKYRFNSYLRKNESIKEVNLCYIDLATYLELKILNKNIYTNKPKEEDLFYLVDVNDSSELGEFVVGKKIPLVHRLNYFSEFIEEIPVSVYDKENSHLTFLTNSIYISFLEVVKLNSNKDEEICISPVFYLITSDEVNDAYTQGSDKLYYVNPDTYNIRVASKIKFSPLSLPQTIDSSLNYNSDINEYKVTSTLEGDLLGNVLYNVVNFSTTTPFECRPENNDYKIYYLVSNEDGNIIKSYDKDSTWDDNTKLPFDTNREDAIKSYNVLTAPGISKQVLYSGNIYYNCLSARTKNMYINYAEVSGNLVPSSNKYYPTLNIQTSMDNRSKGNYGNCEILLIQQNATLSAFTPTPARDTAPYKSGDYMPSAFTRTTPKYWTSGGTRISLATMDDYLKWLSENLDTYNLEEMPIFIMLSKLVKKIKVGDTKKNEDGGHNMGYPGLSLVLMRSQNGKYKILPDWSGAFYENANTSYFLILLRLLFKTYIKLDEEYTMDMATTVPDVEAIATTGQNNSISVNFAVNSTLQVYYKNHKLGTRKANSDIDSFLTNNELRDVTRQAEISNVLRINGNEVTNPYFNILLYEDRSFAAYQINIKDATALQGLFRSSNIARASFFVQSEETDDSATVKIVPGGIEYKENIILNLGTEERPKFQGFNPSGFICKNNTNNGVTTRLLFPSAMTEKYTMDGLSVDTIRDGLPWRCWGGPSKAGSRPRMLLGGPTVDGVFNEITLYKESLIDLYAKIVGKDNFGSWLFPLDNVKPKIFKYYSSDSTIVPYTFEIE